MRFRPPAPGRRDHSPPPRPRTPSAPAITAIASAGANQILTDDGDATVTSEANLTFDGTDLTLEAGNLIIGTHGKGIDFAANTDDAAQMTAEILDDYEEGTFTPTIKFGGSNTGMSYSTQAGFYTKVGRQVTVSGQVELSDKGSSVGSAQLRGLPFTSLSSVGAYPALAFRLHAVTYDGQKEGFVINNDTICNLEEMTEAGGGAALTNSDFSDTGNLVFMTTYFT